MRAMVATFIFFSLMQSAALAQNPDRKAPHQRRILAKKNQKNYEPEFAHPGPTRHESSLYTQMYEVGGQFGYHRYEEPTVMRQTGFHTGINVAFNWYNEQKNFRFTAEGEYVVGTLHYWGGIYNSVTKATTPMETTGTESYRNIRLLAGIPQQSEGETLFTPYAGLAQRYQNSRMDEPNPSKPSVYRREITYWYVPLGIEMSAALSPSLRFRGLAEYDLFLAGTVDSHLSDLGAGIDDLHNSQSSGKGLRTQFGLDQNLGSLTLSYKIYVQFWDLEPSDSVYSSAIGDYLGEPKNDTVTTGLIVGVLF